MATTATLTGTFTLPNDAAPDSAVLSVTLSAMDTDQNTGDVLPDDGSFTVALVAGAIPAGQEIWKNTAGLRGTHYRATLAWTASGGRLLSRYLGSFQVGDDASYDMADLLDQPPIATLPEGWYSTLTQGDYDAAITARDEAVAAAEDAAALFADAGGVAAAIADAQAAAGATAADRVQTGLDRAAAESYAADAATEAGYYNTIALGRAAVADGAVFGVIAGGSDGLLYPTIYRRDSSSAQTLIREVVTPAMMTDRDAEAVYRAGFGNYYATVPETGYVPLAVDNTGAALALALTQAQADADQEALYRAGLWSYDVPMTGDPASAPLILTTAGEVLLSASGGAGGGLSTDAPIRIVTDDGASNAEGQAGASVDIIYGHQQRDLLTLTRGTAADPWLGMATAGGDTLELDGETITGIGPLLPQIAASGTHGTLASEGAARSMLARGIGPICTWSNAEGGTGIDDLLPDAPGRFGFTNVVTALTRAQAVKPAGRRLIYDRMIMQIGSPATSNSVGEWIEDYRAAVEAEAKSILGQYEALRAVVFQSSAAQTSWAPQDSVLAWARAHQADGVYICAGPIYPFPWSSDYLHLTSLGHAMTGEFADAVFSRAERDGVYLPLHAVSAAVTGANEITVTMSEPVEVATDANVAAITNHGLSLTGGTISAVSVSGAEILITTTGAASGVTAVGIARNFQTDPRTEANIPRSNIRAVRPLGAYSWGGLIRAWACHQSIGVS